MQNQKFRLSTKSIVSEFSILFFAIPFLAVAFCGGTLALESMGNSEIGQTRFALALLFGLPAIVIAILCFALVLISIGRAIYSYLLLSSHGLEYRLWPSHKIRCGWDEVDQIKKSVLPFQGDILVLKNAEVSGLQKALLSFNKGDFGVIKTLPVIPLYQIDGWQNGRLKEELIKYAPNLFAEQSKC